MSKKKQKKGGFGQILADTLIGAGTGAAINVLEGAVGPSSGLNYGMVLIGAALPAFMPGDITTNIGKSALAIGAYNVANELDLSGKLGLDSSVSGLNDRYAIGQNPMFTDMAKKKQAAEKKSKMNYERSKVNPLG